MHKVFYKKGVLKNFAKLTVRHLYQSLLNEKETLIQVFSCEFCKIFENAYLVEHLQTIVSVNRKLRSLNLDQNAYASISQHFDAKRTKVKPLQSIHLLR